MIYKLENLDKDSIAVVDENNDVVSYKHDHNILMTDCEPPEMLEIIKKLKSKSYDSVMSSLHGKRHKAICCYSYPIDYVIDVTTITSTKCEK